jgi:hypothetical protein
LAAIQVALSANISGVSDQESIILRKGAVSRYREFAAEDATARLLAIMAVGLHNATMQALEIAAHSDVPDVRNDEMRNANRGAKTVVDLLEALDRHRGRGAQNVTVGQVTVESGAQAVVGNVNAEGRSSTEAEETESQNDPSRAKK